jgi:hypothetical protein
MAEKFVDFQSIVSHSSVDSIQVLVYPSSKVRSRGCIHVYPGSSRLHGTTTLWLFHSIDNAAFTFPLNSRDAGLHQAIVSISCM